MQRQSNKLSGAVWSLGKFNGGGFMASNGSLYELVWRIIETSGADVQCRSWYQKLKKKFIGIMAISMAINKRNLFVYQFRSQPCINIKYALVFSNSVYKYLYFQNREKRNKIVSR